MVSTHETHAIMNDHEKDPFSYGFLNGMPDFPV